MIKFLKVRRLLSEITLNLPGRLTHGPSISIKLHVGDLNTTSLPFMLLRDMCFLVALSCLSKHRQEAAWRMQ